MTVSPALAEPVRRALGWLLSLRDGQGRILCPDHGLAHSGKNAGVIVMACELARSGAEGDRDALLEVAREQAEHLVVNLKREVGSTCFTFRPGRHDPYNCSNSVIDGGACSDALAELVLTFGDRLEPAERERFQHASILHAQTYLRYAILDKGIPAQRAWAMSGVAPAWQLARHDVLELVVREGARILAEVQHPDGSYPYHPLDRGAGHPGASDVSAFYQSRVTAFQLFALERIGHDPTAAPHRAALLGGLEFLAALQGPDGIKCGLVEAKPWYWGAAHEVASHPFDVFALARGWRLFGTPELALAARRAWRAWVDHLGPDGKPTSHHPGPGRRRSYQCPVFWAGHASWMARALEDLQASQEVEPDHDAQGATSTRVRAFPQASLVRLEDASLCAWIRGARPGANAHHGSPRGAGLLALVSKESGEDLLGRRRPRRSLEGEWVGRSGLPSPARGWRAGGEELRFSLWLARNAWRGRRRLEALCAPPRVLAEAVLAPTSGRVASSFGLEANLVPGEDGVGLRSSLAYRDGTPVPGSVLERRYRLDGDGLSVEEHLEADGGARGVTYRLPAGARQVQREKGSIHYRIG